MAGGFVLRGMVMAWFGALRRGLACGAGAGERGFVLHRAKEWNIVEHSGGWVVSAEWKREPRRRKERKEGMEAEERGARREDRLGAVELCGRILGLLQVRTVVRD